MVKNAVKSRVLGLLACGIFHVHTYSGALFTQMFTQIVNKSFRNRGMTAFR